MRAALTVALLLSVTWAAEAQDTPRLEVIARVRLREIQHGSPVAVAYMGAGVTVRVKRPADGMVFGETLSVTGGAGKLEESEGGVFETAALYRFGGTYCLVVTEYTGGAHCCGEYHVFVRAAGGTAWTLAGVTGAENGGPMPAWTVVTAKDGVLYLRETDNRFDYFHACHACSLLGNIGPQYSRLSPGGLLPANDAFRDEYAQLAAAVEVEIHAEAKRRPKRAAAILGPADAGGERPFTDDLGQLLVKRTILLIRAGDEARAWAAFQTDVDRYYQADGGAELLRAEIGDLLRQ